ncbi:MAG: NAD(P)/FAD-dependent oxidoreductase, partial [Beijerinckiaceae bacterium]
MTKLDRVVVLGAGHAGVQAAASLREEGFTGEIHLVDGQSFQPYQRPPLSKAFLKGETTAEGLVLRGQAFYADNRIDLHPGCKATEIDARAKTVRLADGGVLAYDALVLATGARARPLALPGVDLDGVLSLRDLADAEQLKARLAAGSAVAVIGAGFIGLEFAAVAAKAGKQVTVVETAPRVMGRAVSPAVSEAFAAKHRAMGTDLRFGAALAGFI